MLHCCCCFVFQVPDYHEIIIDPMDLGTMMKKIDEHCYTLPKQWIADIELIAKNALEYVVVILHCWCFSLSLTGS